MGLGECGSAGGGGLQTDKVSNNLYPKSGIDIFSESHELDENTPNSAERDSFQTPSPKSESSRE